MTRRTPLASGALGVATASTAGGTATASPAALGAIFGLELFWVPSDYAALHTLQVPQQ